MAQKTIATSTLVALDSAPILPPSGSGVIATELLPSPRCKPHGFSNEFVYGYHGCSRNVAEMLLSGKDVTLN